MKDALAAVAGFTAGLISWAVGGFDTPVLALVICMALDYVTGLMVAGIFHASPKTAGGGLDSRIGWRGLARKIGTIVIVVVANLADILLELHYIRDAAVIGFCANECISILENAGRMGIRIPGALTAALEVMNQKGEGSDAENEGSSGGGTLAGD